MTDLTSQLLAGLKPEVSQIRIYGTRIADMNDAQCRLALMWVLSTMQPKVDAETFSEAIVGGDTVLKFKGKQKGRANDPD